jgi:hypothetical protein
VCYPSAACGKKSLAALRAGITRVVLPGEIRKILRKFPNRSEPSCIFCFVETLDQVFAEMLTQKPQRKGMHAEYPFYAAQPCTPGWQAQKGVQA